MKISKWLWFLMAVSIVGTLVVYPQLPQQIPIHWGVNGEVDNYGGKVTALFTMMLPLLLALLFIFMPKIDPKKDSYQKHKKAYAIVINLLMVFFIMLHWITLLAAFDYPVDVTLLVGIGVGILFVVIGNYMGQIRPNYFFGIRTPWTLANEKVWTKTHRVGGWVFIVGGLLFFLGGLLQGNLGFLLPVVYILAAVVGLFAYSYLIFKQLQG